MLGTGTTPAAAQASSPPATPPSEAPRVMSPMTRARGVGVEALVDHGPEAGDDGRPEGGHVQVDGHRGQPRAARGSAPHSASSSTVAAASMTGTTCAGERRESAAENASTAAADTTAAAIITSGQRRDGEGGEEEGVAGGPARDLLGDERARGHHARHHRASMVGAARGIHVVQEGGLQRPPGRARGGVYTTPCFSVASRRPRSRSRWCWPAARRRRRRACRSAAPARARGRRAWRMRSWPSPTTARPPPGTRRASPSSASRSSRSSTR